MGFGIIYNDDFDKYDTIYENTKKYCLIFILFILFLISKANFKDLNTLNIINIFI